MATQDGWNITSTEEHKQNSSVPIPQQSQQHDRSGFCHNTGIYNSLHKLGHNHQIPTQPDLHTAKYVLSHFPNPTTNHNAESRIALIDSLTDHRLTYAQLRHNIHSLAAALHHAIGIRKNDVVFLLSPNSLLYPTICLAVLSIGAVLTTANPLNTAPEIAKQIRDSGAKLAISAPDELHKLTPTGVPTLVTTRSSQNYENKNEIEIEISIDELIEYGDPSESPETRILQTDTAAILYSSGTTGVSKGVVLTHANLISVMTLLKWTIDVTSAQNDVFLCFIPMFHIYGLAFFGLGLFCAGSTIVIMPKFDFQSMLDAIEKYRINNIMAVPPVILGLVKSGGDRGLSTVRRVGSGAAPLGKEVTERFREKYPWVELREGYGLTESGGATSYFVRDEDARKRGGSVGQLLPGICGRIVDVESGEGLGPNREGELWVRSATVMKGYLGNEEATRMTVDEEGWLRTGDMCYIDEDGFVYVVDRIKELIKHNGYQVAPAELETVLLSHPLILDAAVIPVKDEEAGQIPMAYVVRSADSELTEDQVIQFVASQVAPYKKVRKVGFISSIPRSAAGKILRKELVSQTQQLFSKL